MARRLEKDFTNTNDAQLLRPRPWEEPWKLVPAAAPRARGNALGSDVPSHSGLFDTRFDCNLSEVMIYT